MARVAAAPGTGASGGAAGDPTAGAAAATEEAAIADSPAAHNAAIAPAATVRNAANNAPRTRVLSNEIIGIIPAHVAMQTLIMPLARRLLPWALLLWFAGCSLVAPKFEKPVLSVVSIELAGGSLLQQNFLVKLNVQNPNDRAVPVTSLHVELHVDGDEIASGASNRAFVVPARGNTEFDVTIKANVALALLKLAARKDAHSDSIGYDMTGEATLDLPFLHVLPFHQSGVFSLRN